MTPRHANASAAPLTESQDETCQLDMRSLINEARLLTQPTVRRRYPRLKLIEPSCLENRDVMRETLDAGALGFIPKTYSPAVMPPAVRLVQTGGGYVPPTLLASGGDAAAPLGMPAPPAAKFAAAVTPAAMDESGSLSHLNSLLTGRQMNVPTLLSPGLPDKQIRRELGS